MLAEVKEIGERPKIWSNPRSYAPKAAVELAKMFEHPAHSWADRADIYVDWQNSLLEAARNNPDLQYPVMVITCDKYVPGKGHLVTQQRLDIDSVFTTDWLNRDNLLDIVQDMRSATLRKLEEANV